ncbi:hypothetical protein CRV15_17755 [Streptomyces clavuligerus]|uniref:Uncharacterized protein n=1 Tax=Streptomyces clavuligerus TaxID=1901 RepID=B5GXV8_STRCL|nr:hypothetical protein D1794_18400 [Streptomyces clavuligerus]EDY51154.1 hypothetical protein SSCG_04182 [Streptomyces clavuligerus]EFG07215.1 Hypothetical protein SCLAV_2142 [Streptomyces clavuligerus]QCS07304.1 hypothetical protein CRV15_17755 [Streptomyces clavuligerus]QPJ93347.1 hypothetical protein GE265_10305 [Streptomyces clavuligerus]
MDNPLRFPPCQCPNPACPDQAPAESAEAVEQAKPIQPSDDSPVLAALRARIREDNARRTGWGAV